LLGLVLNATSGDELAELPRRRIQPVSHTGPVGNTGRIGQRLADVPRPGSDASRSPGPGTLHVWTVDRCGVILGLRLTNQPGPLRVPGWHSNSDKPRQARTRPRWCPPGGPGCSTAHDAPQTDAARTACLQAARAAQPSTLHVRGVRQPAASAEAAAARASAGTTPTGRQATPHGHPTRRAGARALDASRQLPILGRRSEPGVFPSHLRVPPVRPAKHHPHHYRRGKPSGQADQHPPPQAHPNPKRHIPKSRTRAVPSTHHTTSHASALRPSPLSPSPLWRNHAHRSWATSPAAISAFLKLLVWLTSPHLHHAAITHPHQTWD
jgi:hypothetical protein